MTRRRSGQGRSGSNVVEIILQAQDAASKIIQKVKVSTDGLGQTFDQIAGASKKIFFIGEAFQQITGVINAARAAAAGFYDSFIQSNVELQEQLLSTQASLAATNQVLRGGIEISDPTEAIQALEAPVRATLEQIRADSLDLVGVTSQQLVPIFQILAQESSAIGASLGDAGDLTVDFAAALGTLGIPLDFARQEIQSILQGQISVDSQLAKSIGLNNEQVNLWRQQGTLVENLRKRLEAFRAGNALAAQTIGGISSNILEIFQEATRIAGEPLLEPIVEQLQRFYDVINNNRDTIDRTLGQAVQLLIEVGDRAIAVFDSLLPSLQRLGTAIGQIVQGVGGALADLFLRTVDAGANLGQILSPVIDLIASLAQQFARFADTGLGKTIIQLTAIGAAIALIVPLLAGLPALLAGAASGLASVAGGAAAAAAVGAAFVALREPILAVAQAVGRFLVGAFNQLRDLFEAIRPSLAALGQGVADFARDLAPVAETFRQGFLLSFELLQIAIGNAIKTLGFFLSNARATFGVLITLAKESIGLFVGPLLTSLNALGVTAADIFSALKAVASAGIFDAVIAALERFGQVIKGTRDLLRSLGLIQEEVNTAFGGTADVLAEASDAFDNLAGAAGDAASEIELVGDPIRELQRITQQASQEIGREKIRIDADQSEQLATLQEQLNQGLISEREFQNQRRTITDQGLQAQLEVVRSRAAELRAEYEALTDEQKAQATEALDQILQLETQSNQLRQQVAEQSQQGQQALRDQDRQDLQRAQQAATDAIKKSATEREIELQKLRTQGLLSERELQAELTKINADRVDETLAQEEARLAELKSIRAGIADSESQEAIQAEQQIRESEQRILDLTKERLTTEQQLQQQAQEEIIRAIEKRAQAAQNAATRETQAIEQQLTLYDSLNGALQQQANLLQAQADLRSAENNLVKSNFDIVAGLTKNERERQRIQSLGAVAQLEALQEQQAFEDQSLAIQQELERLAVRRRQIEAEAAEIQARAAVAQAEAEQARTQAAFERGDASEGDVEAANLGVAAAQAGIEAAQRRRGLADREAVILPLQQELARQRQDVNQQTAFNQARGDVVQSLPENSGLRRRLANQLRDELLSDDQLQASRSQRSTNRLAERAFNGGDTNVSGRDRTQIQGTQLPQLPAFDAAIAPLQAVQEGGNLLLEKIAANTEQSTGNAVTVNVTVQGGATNAETGQSVAEAVRNQVENILDQAAAIQVS
ncbi:MAG: hypothetical protein AAFO83_00235 [Cyanobacteria bacterium J06607_13]